MDAKDEMKKAVLTEPVKIIIGAIVPAVAVWIASQIPYLRDDLWPLIPKWFLLLLAVIFLSSTCLLLVNFRRTRIVPKEPEDKISANKSDLSTSSVFGESITSAVTEPNILCLEKYVSFLSHDDHDDFVEVEGPFGSYQAILLTFSNQPLAGKKVKELTSVKAQIVFSNLDHSTQLCRVMDAVWLDTRGSAWFDVGTAQTLLLCLVGEEEKFVALDRRNSLNPFFSQSIPLPSDGGFQAIVQLIGDNQWMQEHKIVAKRQEDGTWQVTQLVEASVTIDF